MSRTLAFAIAIALGATLVMAVQPMSAKAVLPTLGGTPAVWNASMLFFQGALLLGYLLAHLLVGLRSPHAQVLLLAALLGGSMAALPIAAPTTSATPAPSAGGEVAWIVGAFARTVLPPLVLVAAGAPLLMRWFARTGAEGARDPHFLYSASNAGSLVGLLAYPFLVEPLLPLPEQRAAWSVGFALFAILALGCGFLSLRPAGPGGGAGPPPEGRSDAPSIRRLAWWALLAFVPSSLMLGVTHHVTTDVATIPLFWVVPLGLYLLTFVIAFARRPPVSRRIASLLVVPVVVIGLLASAFWWALPVSILVGMACVLLLVGGLAMHGRLAAERPPPEHLTSFYLAVAVGGAVGGIVHALVAPAVFDAIYEYPLAMGLCVLLRDRSDLAWPSEEGARLLQRAADAVVLLLLLVFVPWNERVVVSGARLLSAERTFFGLHRVFETEDGALVRYHHGTTMHGIQRRGDPSSPLAYYHASSGVGRLLRALEESAARRRAGFVGLGVGTLATWSRPGERWTFFEIDEEVVRIARDERLFTYLRDAAGTVDVVVGDARRSIDSTDDRTFDLLVLDAFSSDAVPTHLLTVEAFALYRRKLQPNGPIAVHVTNRHVALARAVAATAAAAGLRTFVLEDPRAPEEEADGRLESVWVVVTGDEPPPFDAAADGWTPLPPRPDDPPWSDDFADLVHYLKWWRG
ncbi:MAG: fused MFS/spermidine synthase [Planctomycetota bacterium JB042]